jgi:hypothetical protein
MTLPIASTELPMPDPAAPLTKFHPYLTIATNGITISLKQESEKVTWLKLKS